MPVRVLSALLQSSSWLLACEKQPMCLDPHAHMGDLNQVRGSWLHPDPTLPIAAIWRVNQRMKELSLTLCVSPSLCDSFKINKHFFKK